MLTRIVLEKIDERLCGRIYIGDTITSAYIIPSDENQHLFTKEQLEEINNEMF